jgi:hypothetical protein
MWIFLTKKISPINAFWFVYWKVVHYLLAILKSHCSMTYLFLYISFHLLLINPCNWTNNLILFDNINSFSTFFLGLAIYWKLFRLFFQILVFRIMPWWFLFQSKLLSSRNNLKLLFLTFFHLVRDLLSQLEIISSIKQIWAKCFLYFWSFSIWTHCFYLLRSLDNWGWRFNFWL